MPQKYVNVNVNTTNYTPLSPVHNTDRAPSSALAIKKGVASFKRF